MKKTKYETLEIYQKEMTDMKSVIKLDQILKPTLDEVMGKLAPKIVQMIDKKVSLMRLNMKYRDGDNQSKPISLSTSPEPLGRR